MDCAKIGLYWTHERTGRPTGFAEGDHDVGCAVIETGEGQRRHVAPHLEGSGEGVVDQRARHVGRVVQNP